MMKVFIWLEHVVYHAHYVFIEKPLQQLYFNGPAIHGYGFWGGLAREDMCASVTPGTSAVFWATHTQDCDVLLRQHFLAFLTAVEFLTYAFYLYRILSWFFFRTFVMNPTLSRLERLVEAHATTTELIKARKASSSGRRKVSRIGT